MKRLRPPAAPLVLLALLLWPLPALGELPPAERVRELWHGRLDGVHFSGVARLRVTIDGSQEERVIEIWRDDETEGGHERFMARFRKPSDLRNLALLYMERPDRPNDYFAYQPGTGRVRRIAGRLARQDSYGVDLEYLGFGVAQIEPTEIESIEEVQSDGERRIRVRERAKRHNTRFDRRIVWLDPETWVPMRTEHHRDGSLTLRARTLEVETIQGIATPMRVVFVRPPQDQRVDLLLEEIDYETSIPDSRFSTLELLKKR